MLKKVRSLEEDFVNRGDRSLRHFQAGLVLEAEVSNALRAMGVPHRRTDHGGKEDTQDRVDLVVPSLGGRPTLEFQLTLRAKERRKLFAFALRALTNQSRGVRIYLEVVGARRKDDLRRVAENVARAITTIIRRFRDFGAHRLLGVRVDARNAAIDKFDLVQVCGHRLMEAVDAFWMRVEAARRTAQERARRNRETFTHLVERFTPRREDRRMRWELPNVRANTRPLFVPRRHCATG